MPLIAALGFSMNRDLYYTPPREWSIEQVRVRYFRLATSFRVEKPLKLHYAFESDLIKLKHALWDVSTAIKNNDRAAIELAIDFVIADVYFHYSGFIRATMARRLKNVQLSETSKEHLRRGLFRIFSAGCFGPEYKEFARTLRTIGLGSLTNEYKTLYKAGGKQRLAASAILKNS